MVTDIYVTGQAAYVKIEHNGLHLIDLSNPAAPADRGQVDIPQATGKIAVKEVPATSASTRRALACSTLRAGRASRAIYL